MNIHNHLHTNERNQYLIHENNLDLRNYHLIKNDILYKYINHQNGIAGILRIRLIEGRNIFPSTTSRSFFFLKSKTCNPYVIFRIGKHHRRSVTIKSSNHPSWRKELIEIPFPKLSDNQIKNQFLRITPRRAQMTIEVFNEDTFTGKATESVGLSGGSLIGHAIVDFTDLVEGTFEFIDKWILLYDLNELSTTNSNVHSNLDTNTYLINKNNTNKSFETIKKGAGEIRIILQYEPFGMEPKIGDIIRLEGYGYYPTILLPPLDYFTLQIKSISGNYILGMYITKSGFQGTLRLHRSQIYVIHRNSFMDQCIDILIKNPFEFAKNTPLGKSILNIITPYINVAHVFTAPAILAAKTTFITTFRVSSAAVGAIFSSQPYENI